ncbi:plastocyanin [Natronococcus pandeyae]|uniref:Plastocyanin n=1 Tax=Natronococcus pandeyae TaxID=2055836 RepID=A0A8J8Q916_9EURY|nr:plastocyanin/azurin family copper-binding protein [Natronococcus pandeyae]TYL40139.1 plastocyanin [Natronococcus pandeyae]
MSEKEQSRDRNRISRRGVLQGTAAAAGTAAFAGPAAGKYREVLEDLDQPRVAAQNEDAARTFSLLGIVGGWQGVEPAEIDGQSGPTLRLIEGEEHTIYWTNGDGSGHNFVILDENGDAMEATSMTDELGETLELTFTAEPEMTEYICEPHPVQMRGPFELIDPEELHELRVRVEDDEGNPLEAEVFLDDMHSFSDIAARPDPDENDDEDENEETDVENDEDEENEEDEELDPEYEEEVAMARFDLLEDGEHELEVWTYDHERVTEEVTIDGDDEEITVSLPAIEPEDPVETFELRLEEDAWQGVAPDEIADEENPTLELEAEETYEVEWENAIGRRLDEGEMEPGEQLPGHNFAIAEGDETDVWNTHVRSDFTDEEGETQSVEFVAKEEMSVYLDQSQLEAVGEVDVGEAPEDEEAEEEADENDD